MRRLLKTYTQRILSTFMFSFFTFLLLLSPIYAEALDLLTRANWNVDESLYTEEKKFGEVTKLNLVVLETNSIDMRSDCKNWASSLYYYFTSRLGTKDIPFAYLACQDGTILEGAKQKEERSFDIIGGESAINITILTSSVTKGLEGENYTKLETFIISLSEKYSIKKIEVKKLQVDLNITDKSVKLSLVPLVTPITSLDALVKGTESKLKVANRTIQLAIKETSLSAVAVKPGDTIDVKVTVTNNSGFNIYGLGDNSLYAITDNPFDTKSEFYGGSTNWSSLSRVQLLKDTELIENLETKDLIFKVKVPLRGGKLTQDFVLANKVGTKITGGSFKVEVTSNMSGVDVIEIQTTENGKLNVRDNPNGQNVLTKVFPKERYIVLERREGWIKIDAGGVQGWILASYAKAVTN